MKITKRIDPEVYARHKDGSESLGNDHAEELWQDDRDSAWEIGRTKWDAEHRQNDKIGSSIMHDLTRLLWCLCTYSGSR